MKVQVTEIGNKTVILDPTHAGHQKLNKKWGLMDGDILAAEFMNEFCIDAIWTAMKRKLFFKPFITKKRMKNKMKPWDMDRIILMVDYVYAGKIFTEDELETKLEERRKHVEEEVKKLREEVKNLTSKNIDEIITGRESEALENEKKNG